MVCIMIHFLKEKVIRICNKKRKEKKRKNHACLQFLLEKTALHVKLTNNTTRVVSLLFV